MSKKLNILIIGFGSIGRRHANILKKQKFVKKIYIFSNYKNHKFSKFNSLNQNNLKNMDYIIIANKTDQHYKTLKKINDLVDKKIILVEKPLFNKDQKLSLIKNRIFVGYCMRFTPAFSYIKKNFSINRLKKISIISHSNLKKWRKNIHYSKSSSSLENGGGVLFDYSHELDLLLWSFGEFKKIFYYYKKISNLKINSKDFFFFFGKIKKTVINFELNFFSKQNVRVIKIDLNNQSYEIDILKQKVFKFEDNLKKTINLKKISRDNIYLNMHKNILFEKKKIACNYLEGIRLNKILNRLK